MESTVDQVVQNVVTLVSVWGLQLVGALAVLIIGRFGCGVARKSVRRAMESRGVDASLVPFVSNLVYFTLFAAVVIAVLGLFGIETTSLVAVLGTAGLAIGLAVQGTLSNFSSGVMLLLFRPFDIGDYIDAAGVAGTVSEIGVFSTTLNTPDNVKIIVPNSGIFGSTIKNFPQTTRGETTSFSAFLTLMTFRMRSQWSMPCSARTLVSYRIPNPWSQSLSLPIRR